MTTSITLLRRLRSAAPWALRHLILTVVIAGLIAWLVVSAWFPAPFAEISGGLSIFLLMIAVDVVCGPALTLMLLHSQKSSMALSVDIAVIAAVQFSALGYGLYTLSEARPIAIVFEVDRFRVVSYADLDTSHPENIPEWVNPWSFEAPRLLGVRSARTAQEKFESVDASLQGVEPGQRPAWWQDYNINVPEVKQRAKELESLLKMHSKDAQRIRYAAMKAASGTAVGEVLRPDDLLWLPVVSRQSMDWVAFIDPRSARIRGYIHVDGFGD
jgi:hypothetical protein